MTQKERQARSRHAIFLAALEEFSKNDYDTVTMDSICQGHGISKGMMYHYYSCKDDLFLLLVKELFQALAAQLEHDMQQLDGDTPLETIQQFFMIRERYFQQHPQWKNIFENAMLRPPKHLKDAIYELREPVRALNRTFLTRVCSGMPLRPGLAPETATRYIESIEYVFPSLLRQFRAEAGITDLHAMLDAMTEILEIILFGLVSQTDRNAK